MAKQYNPWTGFLEDTAAKANDEKPTIDNAIHSMDSAKSDAREVYNILAQALQNSTNPNKVFELITKAQGKLLEMAARAKDSKCKTAVDKAIRNCDSKFNKGDLVKIGGSIYKIVGVREKEQKYDLRGILGGGSIYSFDIVDGRGTKLSSFPKGIFTDQWGNKWEITPNDSESYNAKHIKTGERKVFKNDWLRYGGKVEWK